MAAFLLLLLAVAGAVVVANVMLENPTTAQVSVFGQPITGYPLGWLLAMAAGLGFVVAWLLIGSLSTTRRRRERRRQLRLLRRAGRLWPAEPEPAQGSVLDQFFGHDDTPP